MVCLMQTLLPEATSVVSFLQVVYRLIECHVQSIWIPTLFDEVQLHQHC